MSRQVIYSAILIPPRVPPVAQTSSPPPAADLPNISKLTSHCREFYYSKENVFQTEGPLSEHCQKKRVDSYIINNEELRINFEIRIPLH